MLETALGIVPSHLLGTFSELRLRDIFDSSETVNDRLLTIRLLSAKTRTETAITNQHR